MSDDYDEQPTTALPWPSGYGADPRANREAGQSTDWATGLGTAPGGYPGSGYPSSGYPSGGYPSGGPGEQTARFDPWARAQRPYAPGSYQYGPAGTGVETQPGGGPGGRGDRRWIWLAAVIGFALLAVGGLIALTAVMLPSNGKPHQTVKLGNPSPTVTAPASAKPPSTVPASQPTPTIPTHTRRVTIPPPITATPPLDTSTPTAGPPTRPGQGVQVPNVVGLPVQQAIARLQAAGFSPHVVSAPIGRPQQANQVFLQSPRGGQTAPRGSVVTIVISAPLQPR